MRRINANKLVWHTNYHNIKHPCLAAADNSKLKEKKKKKKNILEIRDLLEGSPQVTNRFHPSFPFRRVKYSPRSTSTENGLESQESLLASQARRIPTPESEHSCDAGVALGLPNC
eukprot:GHVU01223026.1.p3 GENE.GHVU01223026.1~~GHVU01223026.1.p3  ORF type:complete len:115 (-),score=10.82 GHVU01223026.1:2212-2556(-)